MEIKQFLSARLLLQHSYGYFFQHTLSEFTNTANSRAAGSLEKIWRLQEFGPGLLGHEPTMLTSRSPNTFGGDTNFRLEPFNQLKINNFRSWNRVGIGNDFELSLAIFMF